MITEWKHRVLVICVNRNAGNSLARLAETYQADIRPDLETFTDAIKTTPQGWAVSLSARDEFVDIVNAFNEDAPVDDPRLTVMVSRGLTASLWAQAKTILHMTHYQYWKEDGSRVEETTLEDFAVSKGYTLIREDI